MSMGGEEGVLSNEEAWDADGCVDVDECCLLLLLDSSVQTNERCFNKGITRFAADNRQAVVRVRVIVHGHGAPGRRSAGAQCCPQWRFVSGGEDLRPPFPPLRSRRHAHLLARGCGPRRAGDAPA